MREYLLPCYFVLVLGTLFLIGDWLAKRRKWYAAPREPAADKLSNDAAISFRIARMQFQKWRRARPLLHVRQSPYACSLVQKMIFAYKLRLIFDEELDRAPLSELYRLLGDLPPSHDPPGANKPLSGGLLFIPS